jgi:hypothetical protein
MRHMCVPLHQWYIFVGQILLIRKKP